MSASPISLPPQLAVLQPAVQYLSANIRAHPLLATAALGAVPLLAHVIPSYRGYVALGKNGLPNNFIGWFIQACMRPISRGDVTDPVPFSDAAITPHYGPHGRTSFLGGGELPRRRGERPTVPSYVAPQRQITETGDAALVDRMNAHLERIARANPALLMVKPSGLESADCPAMCLRKEGPPLPSYLPSSMKGEFLHVHPEASTHMVLSLTDAEAATRQGWGERHRLSGVQRLLPLSYMLGYAPRDEDEFAQWKRFVAAAIRFTTADSGVDVKLDV